MWRTFKRDVIEFSVSNDLTIEFRKTVMELDEEEWTPLYRVERGRDGDRWELIHWHYERWGKSEEAHERMKTDLAGGTLPSGKFGAKCGVVGDSVALLQPARGDAAFGFARRSIGLSGCVG